MGPAPPPPSGEGSSLGGAQPLAAAVRAAMTDIAGWEAAVSPGCAAAYAVAEVIEARHTLAYAPLNQDYMRCRQVGGGEEGDEEGLQAG